MRPRIIPEKNTDLWVVEADSLRRPCMSLEEAQVVMREYLRDRRACSYEGCMSTACVSVLGIEFCPVHGVNARLTLGVAA